MKVLLLEDVRKLGSKGEIVEVSDGYARNYIIPQKLGREATKQVLNEWEQRKKNEASRKEQERLEAIELVRRLETTPIEIKARAGEGGRLLAPSPRRILRTRYGPSITSISTGRKSHLKNRFARSAITASKSGCIRTRSGNSPSASCRANNRVRALRWRMKQ